MASPLLLLTHFCEIHGPQTILATRILDSTSPNSPPPTSEAGASCANCSYNVPNTTTTPVLRTKLTQSNPTSSPTSTTANTPQDSSTIISSRTTSDPLIHDAAIRALSVETLPKGQSNGGLLISTELSLLGGDKSRGLNIIYVFRLPDPRARGQRRTYAFVCIGDSTLLTYQARVLMAFERWAASIIALNERHLKVLRRQASGAVTPTSEHGGSNCDGGSVGVGGGTASLESSMTFGTSDTPSPPLSLDASPAQTPSSPPKFPSPLAGDEGPLSPSSMGSPSARQGHRATASMSAVAGAAVPMSSFAVPRNMTPVSSFLSAKTVDPDGYPRSSFASGAAGLANIPKTRSLAEIVGDEFFFVRLHAEFCGLMGELMRDVCDESDEKFLDEEAIEDDEDSVRDRSDVDGMCEDDDDGDDHDDGNAAAW